MLLVITLSATAQTSKKEESKKRFSIEEFQSKQRKFITEEAKLTPDEADAFFPLFFELHKKKWETDKEVREKVGMKHGAECSDEQSLQLVREFAEAKIKIAELEREYVEKYLEILPARKILSIQRAEDHFQKEMLKNMWKRGKERKREK